MEPTDYPVIIVKWADAHASAGGWLTLDEYEDDGECLVTTIGYLVPADAPGGKKDHVTVWQTITDGDGIHGFHIPVGMVRSTTLIPAEKIVSDLDTPSV